MEGRNDNYVVTRLLRMINMQVIKENIFSQYKRFVEFYDRPNFYSSEIFNHFKNNYKFDYENEEMYKNDKSYYVLNIEIIFLLFYLLKYFSYVEDSEFSDN